MIYIWSIPHTLFQARLLAFQFSRLGIKAKIVDTIDKNSLDLYLIIGAHRVPALPKFYIVYQTEVKNSHHFNERYLYILNGALAVWEYNEENLTGYSHKNISIIEPCVIEQQKVKKDIDFLFYGWVEGSERRQRIISELQKRLNLKICTNILGEEMFNILARSKVIINIHYYDNSPLELFRISECFSHGCHVVSEGNDAFWSDVSFANSIEDFVIKAKELKDKPFDYDLSKYDNLEKIKKSLVNVKNKI